MYLDLLQTEKETERWDFQTILYILEDLLGGSAAISNIVMRFLGYILLNPEALAALREEVRQLFFFRSRFLVD